MENPVKLAEVIQIATVRQTRAETAWLALVAHMEKWFYRPDLDALRIALATAAAHYQKDSEPVWLYVIGVPGSGKTSIVIECLSVFNDVRILSDLSVSALISGWSKAGNQPKYGILREVGSSAVFLFKDFTTILTKRHDDRDQILGALREIYDGRYSRHFGVSSKSEVLWQGKVSAIAAVTPVIESMWAVNNKMGDRFVQVRLPRVDGIETAKFARRQNGHKKEIKDGLYVLTKEFIDLPTLTYCSAVSPLIEQQMDALAEVVAWCRCHVDRDQKDRIMFAGQPEMPTRLIQAFTQIARGNASLFRRAEIDESDVRLARRVAIDTIPHSRLKLLNAIPDGADISRAEICRLTKYANTTTGYIADELRALNILRLEKDDSDEHRYSFTTEFQELRVKAGLTL
jgi:hypothetical protein